jgi:hypothetical protein
MLVLSALLGIFGANPALCGQSDVSPVSCPMVIRDSHETVVHDLKPNDFESSLPIVSITHDFRPHRVAIVLDASGSMLAGPSPDSWTLVTDIAEHITRQAGEKKAQLALLVFNSEVREVIDFTQGNASVVARVHAIATDPQYRKTSVRGQTAVYDALEKGISLFSSPSQADALLVITDAGDNVSRTRPDKLTTSLLAGGVRLFAVVVAHSLGYRDRTPEELSSSSYDLQGPVEKSGGSLFGPMEWLPGRRLVQVAGLREHIPVAEALTRFCAGMFDDDLIVVQPPSGVQLGNEWKLHFSKPSRDKFPGAHLEYPTSHRGCPITSSSKLGQ